MGRESCGEDDSDCSYFIRLTNSFRLYQPRGFPSSCGSNWLFGRAEDVAPPRAFYKDTCVRVRNLNKGGLTALIFLSRGFFQGDIFSWLCRLSDVGSFFRMLKYLGNFYKFAEMDRDKLLNSIMFADDATIIVSGATHFEVQSWALKFQDDIIKFADFADMELNTGKSFVT